MPTSLLEYNSTYSNTVSSNNVWDDKDTEWELGLYSSKFNTQLSNVFNNAKKAINPYGFIYSAIVADGIVDIIQQDGNISASPLTPNFGATTVSSLTIGSTQVTASALELNILDVEAASIVTTSRTGGQGILVNTGTVIEHVDIDTIVDYHETNITSLTGLATVGTSENITTHKGISLFEGSANMQNTTSILGASLTVYADANATTNLFNVSHTNEAVSIGGTLDVSGAVNINNTTESTSKTTGALIIDGGVGIAKNLNVGSTLAVAGETTLVSAMISDLTSGRVVFAGTNGALEDSGNLTFDGSTLTLSSNHSTTSDYNVATVKYVNDAVQYGVHWIKPCYVATTTSLSVSYSNGTSGVGATLTNSGTQVALSIDGITLSSGDRVLVKDQTSATQNGVYTVTNIGSGSTNWVLTRADDFDVSSEILPGAAVFITNGNTYADTGFVLSSDGTNGTITVGSSDIDFVQFSGVNTVNVTVDRDQSTQSNNDPTTLTEALNDIYYKLRLMDNWLKNILNAEITFSTSYATTTLSF